MATLRSKRKLPVISKENHEDHTMKIQVQNTNSSKIQEDYLTQVSEESEGRVTEKLSQEFLWDRESHFGHPVQARRISFEPTSLGSFRTGSRDILVFKQRKPGNN